MGARQARQGVLTRQLQGALGGKTRRSGTATATWAAGAANSGVVTVTHGFDRAPSMVKVTSMSTGGPNIVVCQPFNVTASTFQFQAGFLSGTWAGGGSHVIAWEAWA